MTPSVIQICTAMNVIGGYVALSEGHEITRIKELIQDGCIQNAILFANRIQDISVQDILFEEIAQALISPQYIQSAFEYAEQIRDASIKNRICQKIACSCLQG